MTTTLTMAKRAKLISPDPQMMLSIENLATELTASQQAAHKNIQPFLKQFDLVRPEDKS